METKSLRVLHTDGNITTAQVNVKSNGILSNAVATMGTDLHAKDSTVAGIRVDGLETYQWTGHATPAQMAAVAKAEQNGGW